MSLFVILWASGMYYAETSSCTFNNNTQTWLYDDGTVTPYQSIPHSLWWAFVTMTTVGYGDNVPVTAAGKIVATGAMLCGILVLAFPLTILAGNFAAEYSTHLVAEEIKELKKLRKEKRKYSNNTTTPKRILKNIWLELLTLKGLFFFCDLFSTIFGKIWLFLGGLDNTKDTISTFDRQFGKIELFVQKFERQLARENGDLFSTKKRIKQKLKQVSAN